MWRPDDVVNLSFQWALRDLVADKLFVVLFHAPYSYGPIVRTGQEDRAVIWVPEWITSNSVNWASVTIESVKVLLVV